MKGQEIEPDESRADVSVHGFSEWGTTALFDMRIVNLDGGSYLCQTSTKALATADKEKNDKYIQTCLQRRRSFTTMVYSVDGILIKEAVAAQQRLASLLSNMMKQEYLGMCGFVRAQMSLAIVRYNEFLLRGARDKEDYILQIPNI